MSTLLSISYGSAVNGTAHDVASYIRTPHGADAVDPLNPYVIATDEVEIAGGVLTVRNGDNTKWSNAGVAFGAFGDLADGFWDGSQGCASVALTFTTGALDDVNFGVLMAVIKNELSPTGPTVPSIMLRLIDNADSPQTFNLEVTGLGWDADIEDTSIDFARDELEGIPTNVRMEWQVGTPTIGGSPPSITDVAHDGFLRVYWNGVQIVNLTNLDLWISNDQDEPNWANGFWVGYSGLMGTVSSVRVADTLCGSSRNLLWGQGHSVSGSDNLMSGSVGTLTGDLNVLFNLDGTPRSRTKSNYFGVFADEIEFGGGGTFTLPDESVSYAKLQNVSAASRLLGRGDSGAGDVQEITLGSGLAMSGTTLAASGAGTLTFVRKTSDESVSSSTTLQADNELLFAVGANQTWEFDFNVHYLGNTTGDFRCGLKFPTSPTQVQYGIRGPATTATGDPDFVGDQNVRGGFTADAVAGMPLGATTVQSWAQLKGFIRNGSNAGNVVLWWAQGTSDGTNTTVKAGSWLVARQIA